MHTLIRSRARQTLAFGPSLVFIASGVIAGCSEEEKKPDSSQPPNVPVVTGPIVDGGESVGLFDEFYHFADVGYAEEEFFVEGVATSYANVRDQNNPWAIKEASTKPYKTRVIVRRPVDPADFNGTVFVEWHNVSAGFDTQPDFLFVNEELLRGGYAYVGVSAQIVGVEDIGFALPLAEAGLNPFDWAPLKTFNPERYGTLSHPGDEFSFDIFTQVGRALQAGELLPELEIERMIASGESQSAFRMVTYANAIHPLAGVYDGYLIHSRGSLGTGVEPGLQPILALLNPAPETIRTDLDVPVFQIISEWDLQPYISARQPDTDLIRTWEIAGTAHVDENMQPPGVEAGVPCDYPNSGPHNWVMRKAVNALHHWVKDGIEPARAEPLAYENGQIVRDELGNALGGVRSPDVDVPIAVHDGTKGIPKNPDDLIASVICGAFGSSVPFSAETLRELYPTHQDYVDKVKASAAKAVAAGFLLAVDEPLVVAEAEAAPVP